MPCEGCASWSEGRCHRYPPAIGPGQFGLHHEWRFPETEESDWCEEWRPNTGPRLEARSAEMPVQTYLGEREKVRSLISEERLRCDGLLKAYLEIGDAGKHAYDSVYRRMMAADGAVESGDVGAMRRALQDLEACK